MVINIMTFNFIIGYVILILIHLSCKICAVHEQTLAESGIPVACFPFVPFKFLFSDIISFSENHTCHLDTNSRCTLIALSSCLSSC